MRSIAILPVLYLLVLLGMVSAWPSHYGEVVARADTDTATAADQATTGAAATSDKTATKTDSSDSKSPATETNKETGKETGTETSKETGTATGTKTGKDKSTKTDKSSSTSVDPRDPVGGISMLTPSNGATSYYKIGDYVTFQWKYTSLQVTPSAVNVVASCRKNSETYTLSSNMSVSETGKVVWDTGKYQSNATVPLLTATYTLYVYDVNATLGDTASAGHLGSQIGYNFGMYTPQAYTPLDHYICATCNSALTSTERNAIKFAVGMAAITVASFTWFVSGTGVFHT
ncbi:hypothetical protein ETB97_008817 [Aspergillus alliaceus]|uniref:DUF7137 domain-containing protein n=1 Tax=Petromyces alliaceus TaxID=209559 RepID=A0A5N6G6K7_PETAA|nr:uncharacterized protein BDW43DRAFT_264984 [Aspergillus alliaceus]KAB8237245.1 hypothetical protein BDW43DRAFT_264984 [Aspergillus alliaceus]KAF5855667.1 hypothetical protein ETB97_008817 [Aspergillus burnettii]